MSAGARTSEFKIAAGVIAVLAIILVIAIWKRSEVIAVAAIAGKALTSAAYGFARTAAKARASSLNTLRTWFRRQSGFLFNAPAPAAPPPPEGSAMNPLFTAAGNSVAKVLTTPLALTAAEQTEISTLVAQGITVSIDLAMKLLTKKYPSAATFINSLLALLPAPAAPAAA